MNEVESRAIEILKKSPMSCSNLGAELWGGPHDMPQSYARQASQLMKRLELRGLVYKLGREWRAT